MKVKGYILDFLNIRISYKICRILYIFATIFCAYYTKTYFSECQFLADYSYHLLNEYLMLKN